MDSFLITSLILVLGLTLGIIISCRWYITKMAIFNDWFAMQQNRNGTRGVRNSEQSSDQQSRNQIYSIERDHVPRLDYNEVMSQSKEMELPTYEQAVIQNAKQPTQVI